MKFTFNKNILLVVVGIFVVGAMTFNQIKTTGLIDTTAIIKDCITLWFMAQSLIAHRTELDGTTLKEKTEQDNNSINQKEID